GDIDMEVSGAVEWEIELDFGFSDQRHFWSDLQTATEPSGGSGPPELHVLGKDELPRGIRAGRALAHRVRPDGEIVFGRMYPPRDGKPKVRRHGEWIADLGSEQCRQWSEHRLDLCEEGPRIVASDHFSLV